jgi:translation initiation factor 2A
MVKTYQMPNWNTVLSQKSFFKADRVQLKWNDLGTSLLVFAQTDADKTGKSYYGETNLYLITVAGNYDCRVTLGMFMCAQAGIYQLTRWLL